MRRILLSLAVLGLTVLLVAPTLGGVARLADLFAEGRFTEAREAQAEDLDDARPGEEALWRSRLESDPSDAAEHLRRGLSDPQIPASTRLGMAIQLAHLAYARGENQKVFTTLQPFLNDDATQVPGEGLVLVALALRAGGQVQRARELLAGVKPDDPAFATARYFLGDLGLDAADPELALSYFESGQRNSPSRTHPQLASGRWRALRSMGKDGDAARLLEDLRRDHPSCLALGEIERVMRSEEDENEARLATHQKAPADTVATSPQAAGRYALQLGAFSDRSLALEFSRRMKDRFQDLSIDEVRDSRGQFLYKIRTGSFVNPALARSEARRLRQQQGIEVIVVEKEATFGTGR